MDLTLKKVRWYSKIRKVERAFTLTLIREVFVIYMFQSYDRIFSQIKHSHLVIGMKVHLFFPNH